ncbi:MAG: DUF4369 domain-containing protein [Winogradskyella sp.]|uniref:DUF4369 domain-containing protein n=1 Tax=Winogradskyella sp. TaxID=1883156 RepID=UPI001D1B7CEB|nr:DUF4369 domain-containing protein [Winogradskyella sp.]NQZ85916.1 DUF4369 domain-containing protein [Nanoarchaeales archaeon]NRB83498.1 DUF4369 domain-containing protein [Winogradskyella sp.]
MKKITMLFVLLFIFSCQKNNLEGFLLKGDVKGLNNSTLLVLKFIGDNMELDSISVSNDKFEYKGNVDEPYFVQLLIKDGKSTKGKLTEFMLENSKIEITGNSIEYDSVKVKGSKSDKTLKKYFADDKLLSDKWDKLKVDYDKFVEENDTINRKKIAKQLNQIVQVDKVNLVKKYVRENSNSKIGALIPNFCTIENELNQNDWKEIYEYLTPEIRETGYGKRILKKLDTIN